MQTAGAMLTHTPLSGIIYPGEELVLEFEYKLPVQLPESYGDDICQTEYHLEARVKHDDNINHDIVVRKEFSVSNPLDLNTVIIPDILVSIL